MNIVIDDKLMRDTLRATGLHSKRAAVEAALRTLLRLSKQGEIRRLRGNYFKGRITAQGDKLDQPLGHKPLAIGDSILTEVLQGFPDERDFNEARKMQTSLMVVELGGQEIAIQAAKNFRALRVLDLSVGSRGQHVAMAAGAERQEREVDSVRGFELTRVSTQ